MQQMIWRTSAHVVAWLLVLSGAAAAAQTTTADQCRRQNANDRAAQVSCARKAFAAAAPEARVAQPPQQTQQPPPLVSPLADTQVMFGFFDRRFPGFNNGLEHLGVDLSAAAGAPVTSICDGTVISNNTGQTDTVSAVVMVEHNCPQPLGKVYAYYGHVHSDLSPGVSVSAGSGIGNVREWPGNAHLHLGLSTRLQEETWGVAPRSATLQELEALGWLNPLDFLAATRPRQAAASVVRPPVRPPVARALLPKAGNPTATSNVKPKRGP